MKCSLHFQGYYLQHGIVTSKEKIQQQKTTRNRLNMSVSSPFSSTTSSNNIVIDFIHSFITAPSPAHAYRHMQLFKILFPAFLEHCGNDQQKNDLQKNEADTIGVTVSDADWNALFEFLLMVAEQPVKDEEEEKEGSFKGTLVNLRWRRLSALDAVSCLNEAITKPHRSRCRVYTILQGRVAERISHALDFQHHQLSPPPSSSNKKKNSDDTYRHHQSKNPNSTTAASALMGSIRMQMEGRGDDDNDDHLSRQQQQQTDTTATTMNRTNSLAGKKQRSVTITVEEDDENIFGEQVSMSTTSQPSIVAVATADNYNNKEKDTTADANDELSSISSTEELLHENEPKQQPEEKQQERQPSKKRERSDQTLTEVTSCETLTEDMALLASNSHSIPVTMGLNGSLDLWFFSLDAVPSKMLGSLTETEFVAIETWFNLLPRDTSTSSTSQQQQQQQQITDPSSNGIGGTTSFALSSIKAQVTEGLLNGITGQSQPLTIANVKTLAPRVFEVGGLWKFDCRLLDEWINTFPRGTGTLADVISFLYRDTPRKFIMRRIEGQCLAVPTNQSDAWPADAFCCGELIVPLQSFPPSSSPPALRLSHISTSVAPGKNSTTRSSNLPQSSTATATSTAATGGVSGDVPAAVIQEQQPDANNNPFGGSSGVYKVPDAHLACLSVITFLRIGVTASNRKEFLTALKAWFDAIDFANLGYITLYGLQVTMMRFREPATSPVLVEKIIEKGDDDEFDDNDQDEQQRQQFFQQQQESLANQFSGFQAFEGTGNDDEHKQKPFTSTGNDNQTNKNSDDHNQQNSSFDDAPSNSKTKTVQVYEKNPFLEKANFHECIDKAQELTKRHNNNQNLHQVGSSSTGNNSNTNNNSFFLTTLETLCDIEVKEIFQYAVCSVVQRLQAESFSCAAAAVSSGNNNKNTCNTTQQQRNDQMESLTAIAASLQVLSGENLHLFKPPQGAIITAYKRSSACTSSAATTSSNSNTHFAMAMQLALNATEIFVGQNPELHRPITFELFARACVEVAGLCTTSNSSNKTATSNSSSTQIIHPAILAEVANVSLLRAMRRRSYKHAADDQFNELVAKYQAQVAAGGGLEKAGSKGKTGSTRKTTSVAGKRTSPSTSSSKKKGSGSGGKDDSALQSLFANGPVSFTISPDQRQRLRKRVDACLHSLEGIGFLLVVTNVRAHFRIEKRLQQLAALDEEQQRLQDMPLGKQRRSASTSVNNSNINNASSSMGGRRRSSLAARSFRRASSAGLLSSSTTSTSSSFRRHQHQHAFFDETVNPLFSHLSKEEREALLQISNEASLAALMMLPSSSSSATSGGKSNKNNTIAKRELAAFMMQKLKPIPLMKLDRLFDPTNCSDTMLTHLDASGLLIDYFVKEPQSMYRRLPSHLLSSKARFFRDIGYWSSSKRRVPLQSKYYFANSEVEKEKKRTREREEKEKDVFSVISSSSSATTKEIEQKTQNEKDQSEELVTTGEYILMRTNIPTGCDVAYRFHFEGYNSDSGDAVNTIVCGREGRKGNALVSGEDLVTCDVDDDRTQSISVRNLADGIGNVTAVLVDEKRRTPGTSHHNNNKYLALKLYSPTNTWSVGGFSVSLGVVSELYGAGFLCGVSFEVVEQQERVFADVCVSPI